MFWIYMLRCADDSFYTGPTDDLERRVGEHLVGVTGCYTFSRRPVVLVYAQACESRIEALAAELRIKGWSRAKKQALVAGDWKAINKLGRGKHRHER